MNIKSNNLVSIGMPTRNRAAVLPRALDALLSQTHRNIELIVSDDCSTDETQKICEAYVARDPRVRYVRHSNTIGHIANSAYVLRQARGEYFMWAADDDRWDPRFIQKLVEALEQNPSHQLAMSSYQRVYRDGEIFDSVVFSGSADLIRCSNLALYRKMARREAVHHAICGVWQKPFLEKLFLRPTPKGIHWGRVFMGEAALATRIASVPELLFFKDQNRTPLKKQYKHQEIGDAYSAPFAYSRYVWHLLWHPLTSSAVPVHRKLAVPFLWLETLWFERDRIFWDFVRAFRRL